MTKGTGMTTFLDKQILNAKTAVVSLAMVFSVAAHGQQRGNYEVKTQEPGIENVQLDTDAPWLQTGAFVNDLEALNKKYEAKQINLKAITNNGRVYSATGAVKSISRTVGNKRQKNGSKIIDVVSTGARAVTRDKVFTSSRDYRNAQDQQRYNNEYEQIVRKHQRRYEQAEKSANRADGTDMVNQTYKKMYQDYLAQCRKQNKPIQYKTQGEYVQYLETKPANAPKLKR